MLMIRFQRIGRKNDPAFRIAVLEKTAGPNAGKYVDLVGTYNPKTKATTLQPERIKDWVKKGAQVSPSLNNLLIAKGVFEGTKTQVISRKNLEKNKAAPVVEAPVVEVPVAEVAPEAVVEAPEEPTVPEEVPAAPEAVEEKVVTEEEVAPVAEEPAVAETAPEAA